MSSPCSGRLAEALALAVLAVSFGIPGTKETGTGLKQKLHDGHPKP